SGRGLPTLNCTHQVPQGGETSFRVGEGDMGEARRDRRAQVACRRKLEADVTHATALEPEAHEAVQGGAVLREDVRDMRGQVIVEAFPKSTAVQADAMIVLAIRQEKQPGAFDRPRRYDDLASPDR